MCGVGAGAGAHRIFFRIKVSKNRVYTRNGAGEYAEIFVGYIFPPFQLKLFKRCQLPFVCLTVFRGGVFCGVTMAAQLWQTGPNSKPEQIEFGDSLQATVAQLCCRIIIGEEHPSKTTPAPRMWRVHEARSSTKVRTQRCFRFLPFCRSGDGTHALKLKLSLAALRLLRTKNIPAKLCGGWSKRKKGQRRKDRHELEHMFGIIRIKWIQGASGVTKTGEKFMRCIELAHIRRTLHGRRRKASHAS